MQRFVGWRGERGAGSTFGTSSDEVERTTRRRDLQVFCYKNSRSSVAWRATTVDVVARLVDLDDLIDATDVAALIGLSGPGGVPTYRARYEDFPAPVWGSRGGRCQLWLRSDVLTWARETGRG